MTYCGMKSAFVNNENRNRQKIVNMKAKKCLECDNKTYQEDSVCVLCKTGISKIDDDFIDALKNDNQ